MLKVVLHGTEWHAADCPNRSSLVDFLSTVLLRPVILPFILESLAIHVPEITDSSSNGVDLSDDASERTVLAASFER